MERDSNEPEFTKNQFEVHKLLDRYGTKVLYRFEFIEAFKKAEHSFNKCIEDDAGFLEDSTDFQEFKEAIDILFKFLEACGLKSVVETELKDTPECEDFDLFAPAPASAPSGKVMKHTTIQIIYYCFALLIKILEHARDCTSDDFEKLVNGESHGEEDDLLIIEEAIETWISNTALELEIAS